MKALEIELWAHKIIERVETGQPDEDSRVELKSDWPEVQKAARQLAAHANAARGEPILWLIGIDQKSNTVVGARHMEISEWYEQIKAEFDDHIAPTLKDINFSYEGKSVVALCFETDRFPFVTKIKDSDRLEVPWREGTRTRSAKRSELFKLLFPLQLLPTFEILYGKARLEPPNEGPRTWSVDLELYIEPQSDRRLFIPFHECKAFIKYDNNNIELQFLSINPPGALIGESNSKTIICTDNELIVSGPGAIELSLYTNAKDLPQNPDCDIEVNVMLTPVKAENPAVISARFTKLPQKPSNEMSTWYSWKLIK